MSETYTITIPFPPSVNGYWRAVQGRNILSKRGREYRKAAMAAVLSQRFSGMPLDGRLWVSLDLHPPDRKRRDVDNYSKGSLDALTHAGVWVDDEQIDVLHLLRCPPDKSNPRVVVTITKIKN